MNVKHLALPAVLLALAGCGPQGVSPTQSAANGWVRMSALPLVQDAVRSMAPTFNGKRIPVLVSHVCALGQGKMTQAQSDAALAKIGIDAANLPREGVDAVALLVNGDRGAQLAACAADKASAAFLPLNPADVMRVQPATTPADPKAKPAEPQRVIDQAVLSRLLSQKLGQARADADIFAVIASRLSVTPGLTEADYRNRAQVMFRELAPSYLQRQQQLTPGQGIRYSLEHMDNNQLTFSTNSGVRFDVSTSEGMTFQNYGQLWYGKGNLLGTRYSLQIANLAQAASQATSAR
jgi:hypothetical protein